MASGQLKAYVVIVGEKRWLQPSAWAVSVAQWIFLRVHPRLRVSRKVLCLFLPGSPRV